MRCFGIVVLVILTSCEGRLTSQQRKEINNVIEANKIRKIAKADITKAAFEYGKMVSKKVKEVVPHLDDSRLVDSLERLYSVKMHLLSITTKGLTTIEQQIIEAYQAVDQPAHLTDNIQGVSGDSILYTAPMVGITANDTMPFTYTLAIYMSTQQVILSMDSSNLN